MSSQNTNTGITIHEIFAVAGEKFDPDKAVRLIQQLTTDQDKNFCFRICAAPDQKVAFQILDFDTNDNRPAIDISINPAC